jgi:hypothetical protein
MLTPHVGERLGGVDVHHPDADRAHLRGRRGGDLVRLAGEVVGGRGGERPDLRDDLLLRARREDLARQLVDAVDRAAGRVDVEHDGLDVRVGGGRAQLALDLRDLLAEDAALDRDDGDAAACRRLHGAGSARGVAAAKAASSLASSSMPPGADGLRQRLLQAGRKRSSMANTRLSRSLGSLVASVVFLARGGLLFWPAALGRRAGDVDALLFGVARPRARSGRWSRASRGRARRRPAAAWSMPPRARLDGGVDVLERVDPGPAARLPVARLAQRLVFVAGRGQRQAELAGEQRHAGPVLVDRAAEVVDQRRAAACGSRRARRARPGGSSCS